MNSNDIIRIIMSNKRASRMFKGVYPRDKLPTKIDKRSRRVYIINTDSSDKKGEHWVAVNFNPNGIAEYFDSFGFSPTHSEIKEFITNNSRSWVYNRRLLQNLISSYCGFYVVYFVFMKSRGASLHQLLGVFDAHNLQANDNRARTLVQLLK